MAIITFCEANAGAISRTASGQVAAASDLEADLRLPPFTARKLLACRDRFLLGAKTGAGRRGQNTCMTVCRHGRSRQQAVKRVECTMLLSILQNGVPC